MGFNVGMVTGIVSGIINMISPELRDLLHQFIKDLYLKAQATSNPWDDLGVEFLAKVLGVDLGA